MKDVATIYHGPTDLKVITRAADAGDR